MKLYNIKPRENADIKQKRTFQNNHNLLTFYKITNWPGMELLPDKLEIVNRSINFYTYMTYYITIEKKI